MSKEALELKIGRKIYFITPDDKFLDNSNCVQLITQLVPFHRHSPVLSKRAVKELKEHAHTIKSYHGVKGCTVIQLKKEKE